MQNMQQGCTTSLCTQLALHCYFSLDADEHQPPLTTWWLQDGKNRDPMTANVQQPGRHGLCVLRYISKIFKSTGQQLNILTQASGLSLDQSDKKGS